jgi:hypothetical protein
VTAEPVIPNGRPGTARLSSTPRRGRGRSRRLRRPRTNPGRRRR